MRGAINLENIRELLETAEDKVAVLLDVKTLAVLLWDEGAFVDLCNTYLSDEEKAKLLRTKNVGWLSTYLKTEILIGVADEKLKLALLENYDVISGMSNPQIGSVLATMSTETRKNVIISNKYILNIDQLNKLASTFGIDELCDFFRGNKEVLRKKGVRPYKVIMKLDENKQLEFISKMERADLTLGEKRLALLVLGENTKEAIDTSNFPQEYITALQMECNLDGEWHEKIKVDFANDLEIYRGLDELVYVDPEQLPTEYNKKLLELGDICPDMNIRDSSGMIYSMTEYKSAETWIESVLQEVDPDWTDIQKVAFIDNAIGKKINYTPDYDTEVFDSNNVCALWRIIHSEHGICEGIAMVEKYILDRVGVKSEVVCSKSHSFLRLKGIALPTDSGSQVVGDTLLDPTWNLWSHRYETMPLNFCKSYDELREKDIRKDGVDTEAHKNDEELSDINLSLTEDCLKQTFSSIGIADKDGTFPGLKIWQNIKDIGNMELAEDEIIRRQLQLIEECYPEFATCQNETMNFLERIMSDQKDKIGFNKCVIQRVYKRDDKERRPVLYMYMDFAGNGKKFYFANKENTCFDELSQEEFESKFECYDMDLKEAKGHRPWEDKDDVDATDTRTSKPTVISKEVSEECIS